MTVTTSQLDGWFKRVFADKLSQAIPDFSILKNDIPFKRQEKTGETYNVPVMLGRSHGITWNGGATAGNAFTLNSAISMVTKNAQVSGSELVLRETVSYGAISRSGTGNDESYGPVMDEVPVAMADAANFYLEMALLYGGTSIGAILSGGAGPATSFTLVLTEASWAAGLWAQMENAQIDVYDSTLATRRNETLGVRVGLVVSSVSADSRTVTLTADSAITISNGDVFVPIGANGSWFSGIDKILTNTGSLFGISASTYNLWKSSTYSAGSAPLTMSKVQSAVSNAVVRGLMEEVNVYLSTYTWTDLNNDLAALRRFADSTKSEADIGTQKITFYGANGKLNLKAHPMVKAGEAFIIPTKRFQRVGSSDVSFRLPGMPLDNFFRQLESQAGVELRCYFDQAIIGLTPARCVKITGIDNASL